MLRTLIFLAVTTALHFTLTLCQSCSDQKLIRQCICKPGSKSTEVEVSCKELTETHQVQTALMTYGNCVEFKIEDSELPSLPLDLGPHDLKFLSILDSKMPYISPPTDKRSAFDGLKNLYRIKIRNVPDIGEWDWSKLKDLPELAVLNINGGKLLHISKTFSMIGGPKLTELFIGGCGLQTIAKGGLAFSGLTNLYIDDVPLQELRADMLHEDNKIETLTVFGVNIKNLPVDIFTSMKNLKSLATDSSVLPYLSDEHFQGMKTDFSYYPGDHPIPCDCKYRWILNHNVQYIGVCNDSANVPVDFQPFLEKC